MFWNICSNEVLVVLNVTMVVIDETAKESLYHNAEITAVNSKRIRNKFYLRKPGTAPYTHAILTAKELKS